MLLRNGADVSGQMFHANWIDKVSVNEFDYAINRFQWSVNYEGEVHMITTAFSKDANRKHFMNFYTNRVAAVTWLYNQTGRTIDV